MSSKLDLYNAVKAAVKTVKEIKTFGIWNNQFADANDPKELPFNFPAVFMEYSNIPWTSSQIGIPRHLSKVQKEQKADGVTFTLHFGFHFYKDVHDSFETVDEITELVYFAVQGISGDNFTSFLRTGERQDTDHDQILHWQMDFAGSIQQNGELNTAMRESTVTTVTTTVDLDIEASTVGGIRTNQ